MSRALAILAPKRIGQNDPTMARIVRQVGPCRLPRRRARFGALVNSIVGQQLSTAAAQSVRLRLRGALGGHITVDRVLAAENERLLAAGLSRPKARYIRELACRVSEGDLDLRTIHRLSDDEVTQVLTESPGVGRWTSEMFLMFVLNRPDILPLDDIGLANGYRTAYGLEFRPDCHRLEAAGEAWRPYRTVASWYLWRWLDLFRAGERMT